jgi:coronin-1B/1C/6
MSGRFVRASKFRHVHGVAPKPTDTWTSVKNISAPTDSNGLDVNKNLVAVPITGGGGPVAMLKRDSPGRAPANPFKLNVHSGKVEDLHFSPFLDTLVATGGADCHLALSILPAVEDMKDGETMRDATAVMDGGHTKKVMSVRFHPTANNVIASGSYDQTVKVWDVETQEEVCSMNLDFPPSCMEWNTNGSLLALSNKTVLIQDPREAKTAVTLGANWKSGKGCKVSWINDNEIYGVGFSGSRRQHNVYDIRNPDKALFEDAIDSGMGFLLPFVDRANNIVYLAGKGDASIKYFEWEASKLFFLSEFRSSSSQKGATFLPQRYCDTHSCEIAVAYRLHRDSIEPISLRVPRKSDIFQKDIYPDTYAGIPALTAEQWYAESKNADPITMSMDPKAAGASPTGGVAASAGPAKSRATLLKELAAANERIAELEKQVEALQAS